MLRTVSALVVALFLASCTGVDAPPGADDFADDGKDDSVSASKVDPKLAPLVAFLRNDKNLVAQLGPEGTEAVNVHKRVTVVRYTDFGTVVDTATRSVAHNYDVYLGGSDYRRANGIIDMLSVGDMYLQVHAGYGDDSFIDKLITEPKRAEARNLVTTLLPEAALITADHASTTSTGNYILVLGDMDSGQAIVMTVSYEVE